MVFAWLALCLSWGFQDQGGFNQPADFYIESIEVENSRLVSRAIILAQARLQPQTTYDEAALAQAVRLIRQLPFIIDARFQLRKGSRKSAYILVIRLEEARNYFFNSETTAFGADGENEPADQATTLGLNYFLGRQSLVYAGWSPGLALEQEAKPVFDTYRVGTTIFDLFRRGWFFNAETAYRDSEKHRQPSNNSERITRFPSVFSYSLQVGLPLQRNQWLKLDLFQNAARQDLTLVPVSPNPTAERRESSRERTRTGNLSWELNTSDDAFLPTSGRIVRGGLTFKRTRLQTAPEGVPGLTTDRFTEAWGAFGEYDQYLPGAANRSWRFHATAAWEKGDEEFQGQTLLDLESLLGTLTAAHQWHWRITPSKPRWGDLFFGFEAGYRFQENRFKLLATDNPLITRNKQAHAGAYLAYRGSWALIRAQVRYLDEDLDIR